MAELLAAIFLVELVILGVLISYGEAILKILRRPGFAVKIKLEVNNMAKVAGATLILDSATNRIFVIGVDAAGLSGASLNPGDSVALTIDNTAIATISLDPTPLADPNGLQSVASGVLSPVAPINAGTPFNAVAVATIGGVAQPAVDLELQWQAGAAVAVLEEVN